MLCNPGSRASSAEYAAILVVPPALDQGDLHQNSPRVHVASWLCFAISGGQPSRLYGCCTRRLLWAEKAQLHPRTLRYRSVVALCFAIPGGRALLEDTVISDFVVALFFVVPLHSITRDQRHHLNCLQEMKAPPQLARQCAVALVHA